MSAVLLRSSVLLVLFYSACAVYATDLRVSRLVLPEQSITFGALTKIVFDVANINVLAASGYSINVQVRNASSGTSVFSEVVEGIPIEPFTEERHSTQGSWTAAVAGTYQIVLAVSFQDDIDPSNNVATYTVNVSPAPVLQLAAYYLLWRSMYTTSFFGDAAFDLMITQPSSRWRYANVVMALSRQDAATWILRNILLPPTLAPYTFTTRADLSGLIPNTSTTKPNHLFVGVVVTDQPITERTGLPDYATDSVAYDPRELSISDGLRNTTTVAINTATPDPPASTTTRLKDTVYRGCTMPNLDLDSATYNPTSVPGYAGDLNACAPTAAANSMQWLENSNSKIKSGLTHRKKLEALSKAMKRENNTGVWIEDFIRGKLEYIAANNLPISVKFQVRGLTKDVTNFPDSDYDATAANKGNGGYPQFDFVKKEMADSEDVETFVEYHDPDGDSSKVVGRHVITCTGVGKDSSGNQTFWYKDDGDQRRASTPLETGAGWVVFNDSIPYIESYALAGGKKRITVPYGVVSESYDPTVKQTEKGFFESLRDAVIGLAGRYEHGDPVDWKKSHPIRFMHLFRRRRGSIVQGQEPQPEWIVRNMPIGDVFGPGTYTLVDPAALTITDTDSVELRIQYTNDAVIDAPTFDNSFRTYAVSTIAGPSFTGALIDTTETSLSPGIDAPIPTPNGATYSVSANYQTDDIDVSSLDIADSRWQGASSVWATASALSRIDRERADVTLTADIRDQLLTNMQFNEQLHGVTRHSMMRGLLATIDDQQAKISGRFQSVHQRSGDVSSPRPYGHVLRNESDQTNGVTWLWLTTQLQNGPVLLEVGQYDADKRIGGHWMLVTGIVEHNGLRRLLGIVDVNEGATGGTRRLVGTVTSVDGYLCVAEWSTSLYRAHLTTAIALEYDPTIVFTGVDDVVHHETFDIVVAPQPASESVSVTWSQARSATADVILVDLTGRVLASTTINSDSRRFVWTTSVRDYASGQYQLHIRTGNDMRSVPISIVH